MKIKSNTEIKYDKAIIYCRVSSQKQRIEGHGLDSQEQRCTAYAENRGYKVVAVFKDTFTGGGDFRKRPAMRDLFQYIEDSKNERFVVVFDDIKRLARDTVAHLSLRSKLKVLEVKVECPNFDFDESAEGEFLESILAAQGQLERKQNARQVRQRMKTRLESGCWTFYQPPGYVFITNQLHGKTLVPKQPEADLIKEALEGYASGRFETQTDVRNFLRINKFAIGSKKYRTVYLGQVKRILERIVYAGYIEYPEWGITRRKGVHEGLISLETYEKIQERIKIQGRSKHKSNKHGDFVLRGFVRCSTCDKPLTASWSTSKSGKRVPYYRCNNKKELCVESSKSIPRIELESNFEELLSDVSIRDETANLCREVLTDIWNEKKKTLNQIKVGYLKRIQQIEEETGQIINKIVKIDNQFVQEALTAELEKLNKEKLLLNAKLENWSDRSEIFGTALTNMMDIMKNPRQYWVLGDLADKSLIQKIVFSEKPSYQRNKGFGTPKITPLVRLLGEFETSKSLDVEKGGVEPPSKIDRPYTSTIIENF